MSSRATEVQFSTGAWSWRRNCFLNKIPLVRELELEPLLSWKDSILSPLKHGCQRETLVLMLLVVGK